MWFLRIFQFVFMTLNDRGALPKQLRRYKTVETTSSLRYGQLSEDMRKSSPDFSSDTNHHPPPLSRLSSVSTNPSDQGVMNGIIYDPDAPHNHITANGDHPNDHGQYGKQPLPHSVSNSKTNITPRSSDSHPFESFKWIDRSPRRSSPSQQTIITDSHLTDPHRHGVGMGSISDTNHDSLPQSHGHNPSLSLPSAIHNPEGEGDNYIPKQGKFQSEKGSISQCVLSIVLSIPYFWNCYSLQNLSINDQGPCKTWQIYISTNVCTLYWFTCNVQFTKSLNQSSGTMIIRIQQRHGIRNYLQMETEILARPMWIAWNQLREAIRYCLFLITTEVPEVRW